MISRTYVYAGVGTLFGAFVLSFLSPTIALAQEKVSLKVQPSLIEERVEANDVIQKDITVTNFSSENQTLYTSAKNIIDVKADGTPVFAQEGEVTPYDVSSWVSFSAPSFVIKPGESRIIPVTIKVPGDVGPGGHYGGVFFTQNPPELTQSGTGVGYQVGTLLNLRVSGEVDEQVLVREFQSDKLVYGEGRVRFTTRVENTGNVLVRPRGPVEIINTLSGKTVDRVRMNDAAAAIFPKGQRAFDVEWESKDLRFGRYSARMVLSFGDIAQQNTIPNVTSFWILPSKVIIPGLIFLLFFVLITWILMRMYVAKRLRELSSYSPRGVVSPGSGMSRLAAVTIALLLSVIAMLVVLFVFF